jgi:hypothetical protein
MPLLYEADGRPAEPDYRCKRCGLPGYKKFDGHLTETDCITALLAALHHHNVQPHARPARESAGEASVEVRVTL